MHSKRYFRNAASGVLSLILGLQLTSLTVPLQQVHASTSVSTTPTLVLSEMNWGGSSKAASDQWLELYNQSATVIDFTATPYSLVKVTATSTTPVVQLGAGSVPAHGYFLVSAQPLSNSTLAHTDFVSSALALSNGSTYELEDASSTVVDAATVGLAGTSVAPFTSQARLTPVTDGTLAAAWFSPKTLGAGFTTGTVQYGTPQTSTATPVVAGAINPELSAPVAASLTLTPNTPNSIPFASLIGSAGAALGASSVLVTLTRADATATPTTSTGTVLADGSFTALITFPSSGVYRLSLIGLDAAGDHSLVTQVPVTGSAQGLYTVNPITVTTVAPPVVTSNPPAFTKATSLTISGTVDPTATLVLSVNGADTQSKQPTAGTFSFSVPLTVNQLNSIELRAQVASVAGAITSLPTTVAVGQESSIAALDTAKLVTAENFTKTGDQVSGQAGAGQNAALVQVYSDPALAHLIGSGTVLADGSFFPIAIANDQFGLIYLTQTDQIGNVSPVVSMVNQIPFSNVAVASISTSSVGQNQVTVSWTAPNPLNGTVSYHLKYMQANGSFTAPMSLCTSTTTVCSFQTVISGLQAGTAYSVAIAPVDQFGNDGAYTTATFTTQVAPTPTPTPPGVGGTVGTPLPLPTIAPSTPAPTAKPAVKTPVATPAPVVAVVEPTPTPTVAPTATPTLEPSASPTDDSGQVKSAQTTRNWTPWIILAILVGLAILATAGYFYWFGGEAGEAALAGSLAAKEAKKPDMPASPAAKAPPAAPETPKVAAPKVEPEEKPQPPEKRW